MNLVDEAAGLAGLTVHARAEWPEPGDDREPTPIAGFVGSSFSPLVAEVAGRCLRRRCPTALPGAALLPGTAGAPGTAMAPGAAGPDIGATARRTALVLATRQGDLATATAIAHAVDSGRRRVTPLLFFQSVPNSVLGHLAAQWRLTGPVVTLSTVCDAVAEAAAVARGLIDDGDADEALILVADQGSLHGARDAAVALLVGPAAEGIGKEAQSIE